MLDPLTALGLASNIVQLLTFTSDLVSKSREYYHSADGSLIDKLELEAITSSLQKLSSDLAVPTSERSEVTQTERQLKELCTGCKDITRELLDLIRSLKSDGSRSRWESFRQALRSIWQEERIKDLETRLDRYRRQVDTTLLISLRESIEGLPKSERRSNRVSQFVLPSRKRVKQWEIDLVDELHQSNWKVRNDKDIVAFSSKLSMNVKVDRDTLLKHHILERLRFIGMEDRAERIPEAHRELLIGVSKVQTGNLINVRTALVQIEVLGEGQVMLASSHSGAITFTGYKTTPVSTGSPGSRDRENRH